MNRIKEFLGLESEVETAGQFSSERTVELNFRDVPLETVLNHLSDTAGWFFRVKPNVDVKARVNALGNGPLTGKEALHLLQETLHAKGCLAIRDGRMLTIIRREDVKKSYIPIRLAPLNRLGSGSEGSAAPHRLFLSPLPVA